ncbi:MAG: ABC transporter substrate-binding protein [Cyanobacteria bacterium J06627_8]
MMRWRLFLTIVSVSVLIFLGTALSNQRQQDAQVLHVATSPDYCPYEFIDSTNGTNALVGFDIDVVEAIAEQLDAPIHFDAMPFNQIILALRSREADVAIAALTPTEERKQVVSFSVVYHVTESLIISPADRPIDALSDLSNQRIGVKPGTVHAQLASTVSNGQLITFDRTGELVRAVKTGEVDAAILDAALAPYYVRQRSNIHSIVVENDDTAGVAIALPKRSSWLRPINETIRQMQTDGTLDDLALKWFDDYVCAATESD